ncbi:MAG: hypothetical protein J6T80_04900 [Paludibacteraceae bacterium]|nr:hypothetical protein [Paludibacteraceae bacterium]
MDYDNPFFEDEPEYYHDAYGDTETMEQKVGQPLSLSEIKEFMNGRSHVTYDMDEMELLLDERNGLYYTEQISVASAELLINHCIVEQCMEHRGKVDWERVTDKYDYRLIDKIERLYTSPLTWVYPAEKIGHNGLVWGLMAAPETCEERLFLSNHEFFKNLRELAIRWFAINLPTKKDIRGTEGEYYYIPNDIILWDRLCSSAHAFDSRGPIFNPLTLQKNIELIAENIGSGRAAQIVRLLREDWPDIKALKLFGLKELTTEQIEEFEQCLFAGMDRNLRKWEDKAPVSASLEDIFNLRFRRTDEFHRFLKFLEQEKKDASDADWARYALAIYEADVFIHRPAGFKKWLPIFCELFGRKVDYQDPNKLKRTNCKRDISAFLP